MSLQDPPYKIVLERSATFQHYYLIHVYPPAPLTVTTEQPVYSALEELVSIYVEAVGI